MMMKSIYGALTTIIMFRLIFWSIDALYLLNWKIYLVLGILGGLLAHSTDTDF